MKSPPGPASRRLITGALLLGIFLAALDVLVVAPAIPAVVADLGGLALYPWVFAAYLLTSTVTAPIYGRLADAHGRKSLYLTGLAFFLVGSALCGLAPSMPVLVGMRVVQGLGAGALLTLTLTLIGDLYRFEERARMQGVVASVWGVASVIGAPIGGFLVEHVGWRAVFYINLPFGLAAAWIIGRRFVEPEHEHRAHELDIPGALALSLGLASGLIGLQRLGRGEAVTEPLVGGALLLSLILLTYFVGREQRAHEPLVDPALFRERLFLAANAGGFLAFGALYSATAFVPLLVRSVRHGSAQEAGLSLVPLSLAWVVASAVSGRALIHVGYRVATGTGGALIFFGCLGLSALRADSSTLLLHGSMMALGAGLGLAMTGFLIAVQSAAPPGKLGIATSSVQFFRSLGAAFGVSVLGAVLLNALRRRGADTAGLSFGDAASGTAPSLPPELLMGALREVFLLGAAFAALAWLAGLAMPGGDAHQHVHASRR